MKYHNQKTRVAGRLFASKREARRYSELRLLVKAGEVFDLECQPVITCKVNGQRVCNYIADFRYRARKSIADTYEDVKGFKTPVYRLKKKLVKACTGIEIIEI